MLSLIKLLGPVVLVLGALWFSYHKGQQNEQLRFEKAQAELRADIAKATAKLKVDVLNDLMKREDAVRDVEEAVNNTVIREIRPVIERETIREVRLTDPDAGITVELRDAANSALRHTCPTAPDGTVKCTLS